MPDGVDILSRAQLLERIEDGWHEVREQIRHLGRAGLRERTPTGWTYKDLLAHMAAWEEEGSRRLRSLVAGSPAPRFGSDAEVDAFNARATEERRLVGAEAILDELEAAHRQLLKVVQTLSDDLIRDPGVQRWIGGNTFAHYAEHRDELAAFSPR